MHSVQQLRLLPCSWQDFARALARVTHGVSSKAAPCTLRNFLLRKLWQTAQTWLNSAQAPQREAWLVSKWRFAQDGLVQH